MTNETDRRSDTIIDLEAEQLVENGDTTTPPPTKPHTRKRNLLYVSVALLAALAGGAWLYRDVLSAYIPPDQVQVLSDKVLVLETSNAALREQLTNVDKLAAQLKSDIDSLEAKDAALSSFAEASQKLQGTTAEKLVALEQGLGEARKSLADVSARPAVAANGTPAPADSGLVAALAQRIEGLEKDVASLKTKPAEAVDNRAVLSQGLADLKAKVASGTGFRDEYERIQRMVPAASGLDVLQQHAALGLPDAKGLGAELKDLTSSLPKPIVPGPVAESEGWWAGIYNSLSGLITIRIEGDVDWPSAALAAAALADSGDLPQAIEQLAQIEGEKPPGVQQWIDRAQARLALEAALKSVEDAVLRVIAAKG